MMVQKAAATDRPFLDSGVVARSGRVSADAGTSASAADGPDCCCGGGTRWANWPSACEIPSHMASEHLRLMQRCGLLRSQRDGRCTYYEVAQPHLAGIIACIESRSRDETILAEGVLCSVPISVVSTGKARSETLIIIVLLLGWFALQVLVLPKLGDLDLRGVVLRTEFGPFALSRPEVIRGVRLRP